MSYDNLEIIERSTIENANDNDNDNDNANETLKHVDDINTIHSFLYYIDGFKIKEYKRNPIITYESLITTIYLNSDEFKPIRLIFIGNEYLSVRFWNSQKETIYKFTKQKPSIEELNKILKL